MTDFNEYIDPLMLSLLPILYAIGSVIKSSPVADWKIPYILGAIGVALGILWMFAFKGGDCIMSTIAYGGIQGLFCSASAVYSHNLIKQYSERKEKK